MGGPVRTTLLRVPSGPQLRADAIGSLYSTLNGPRAKRVWILDDDLSAAFDRIDHTRLLEALGSFPARELVARWLAAGVIEKETFTPTEGGTPQGGVMTPPTQWATSASTCR